MGEHILMQQKILNKKPDCLSSAEFLWEFMAQESRAPVLMSGFWLLEGQRPGTEE